MPSDLDRALLRFRRLLRAREERAVRQMAKALNQAERRIFFRWRELSARMVEARQAGEPVSEAWLYQQARYHALIFDIEEQLVVLGERAGAFLTAEQGELVAMAEEHARKLAVAGAGRSPAGIQLTWNRLPAAALENLVGFASDGSPLHMLFEAMGPVTAEGVREALTSGLAQGRNPREVGRELRKVWGLTRTRADSIARTELLRSYRRSAAQSYERNRDVLEGWVWTSALDRRACAACWALHGSFHRVDEPLDGHIRCRCTAAPRTKSWGEILGDETIPDTRPVIEAGETVFGRLPVSAQREILGVRGQELYAGGDVSLRDFVHQQHDQRWGSQRVAATIDQALANARQS